MNDKQKIYELETKLKGIEAHDFGSLLTLTEKIKEARKQTGYSEDTHWMGKLSSDVLNHVLNIFQEWVDEEIEKSQNLCLMCTGVSAMIIYEDYLNKIISLTEETIVYPEQIRNKAQEALQRVKKLRGYKGESEYADNKTT